MHPLLSLLFFSIPLLYYYINLISSIICFLSCGDICLSFGISLLVSFGDNSSEYSSFECNSIANFFDVLVILSSILLPGKSPVASAVF